MIPLETKNDWLNLFTRCIIIINSSIWQFWQILSNKNALFDLIYFKGFKTYMENSSKYIESAI